MPHRQPSLNQLEQQRQECWPCCHLALFRLAAADGSIVWHQDWGRNWTDLSNNATINSVDSDGTNIYAGGTRAADKSAIRDAEPFCVRAYDGDGNKLWQTDVGGDVSQVLYVDGVGLVVGHKTSCTFGDPLLIQRSGTATWTLVDDFATLSGLAYNISRDDLQAKLDAVDRLKNKILVSGDSLATGFTLTFDYRDDLEIDPLTGPTGLRPMTGPTGGPNIFLTSTSGRANVTLLSADNGSILWRVAPLSPPVSNVTTTGLAYFQGKIAAAIGAIYMLNNGNGSTARTAPTGYVPPGFFSGGIGGSAAAAILKKSLATNGTNLYVSVMSDDPGGTSNNLNVPQVVESSSSFVGIDWWGGLFDRANDPAPIAPLFVDPTDVWAYQSNGSILAGNAGFARLRPSPNDQQRLRTDWKMTIPYDACYVPDSGNYATVLQTNGSVNLYNPSKSQLWSVGNGVTFTTSLHASPRSVCPYGEDLIVGCLRGGL